MKYNRLVMNLIILHDAHNVTIVLGSCGKKRGRARPKCWRGWRGCRCIAGRISTDSGNAPWKRFFGRAHAELRVSTSIPLLSQGPLQAHDSCKYSSSYHQQPEIIYAGQQRSLLGKLLRKL